MSRLLDDHQVEQRTATIIAKLEDIADVSVVDAKARGRRSVDVRGNAPGSGLPPVALFEYRELYEVSRERRWRLAAYAYEFLPVGGGRRAYHWHDDRFHAHCVDPRRPPRDHHFRAPEFDVFEAHDEFALLYHSGELVTCDDLRSALG